jgi:hypothetical protein
MSCCKRSCVWLMNIGQHFLLELETIKFQLQTLLKCLNIQVYYLHSTAYIKHEGATNEHTTACGLVHNQHKETWNNFLQRIKMQVKLDFLQLWKPMAQARIWEQILFSWFVLSIESTFKWRRFIPIFPPSSKYAIPEETSLNPANRDCLSSRSKRYSQGLRYPPETWTQVPLDSEKTEDLF